MNPIFAFRNVSETLCKRQLSTTKVNFKHGVNVKKFLKWDREKRRLNTDEFPDEYTTRNCRSPRKSSFKQSVLTPQLSELRLLYPEFLPSNFPERRHKIKDLLEREDMLKRRTQVDLPSFYVGSILAVTVSDPYAAGKVSRFLGICISREGQGLRANFTLRNIIDGEGVEIRYDMYNPTIREVEVIKLEKRLDDELYYLRDALPEYSYFPQDMLPVVQPPGEPVPLNPLKVKMKPYPWTKRWEALYPNIKGIVNLENVPQHAYRRSRNAHYVNERFDLMKEYREHITEEDQLEIWENVHERLDKIAQIRKVERRRKFLQSN
ncbi:39S ribosomal protein L19: mitochondrial-like protein [Dinothrombium tinctorium]|uniref:Large ribosomal subunit protein bL19m n=1 Tax=Dinothrombium tinctorium TaxID=1965070 RepID=A0A3S3P974_9ACAR|nr:39S ribosomal protein L19: mitochondrial-like protein [Dinothrombium tinctorium]RWS15058.1 39S ribosomal protein L19: mitochondrial-like protein [Dinothrombium tinctorium]